MFNFKILKNSERNLARLGKIKTTHGKFQTPVFMPCATKGSVKGISSKDLKEIGFEIILGNTYHLYLRPGDKFIKKQGGLQKFINWDGPILTDSGGFQVFSLGANFRSENQEKLAKVDNRGVTFKSHLDGSKHRFTPEKTIEIQENLGSDIMMVLDECTEFPATYERAKESVELTNSWAKKAAEYWEKNSNDSQALFGIIQGSTYEDLRLESAKFISGLSFDGIAVGGVSVGEGKNNMRKIISLLGPILPKEKPHYLMGVGEPEDIIFAVKHGFDMFDCVLPTRLGRHGRVWVTKNWQKFKKIDLRKNEFANDKTPIMNDCQCPACKEGYSKNYIGYLIREKEMLGGRLASLHNLFILKNLTLRLQKNI